MLSTYRCFGLSSADITIAALALLDAGFIAGDSMSNIINLKEYRDAKVKSQLDEWAKFWIAYWCWIGGLK